MSVRGELRFVLFAVFMCIAPCASSGQMTLTSVAAPSTVTSLAMRYLHSIHDSNPWDSPSGQGEDYILVGMSRHPSNGWRTLVIREAVHGKPRVVWDSYSLHDGYFSVIAPDDTDSDADGSDYVVTLRGCVPHNCADGMIGFALYSSRTGQTYVSHVTTQNDGSYEVTYYPKTGIPSVYREDLVRIMCSDAGISQPSALPIKCSTNK